MWLENCLIIFSGKIHWTLECVERDVWCDLWDVDDDGAQIRPNIYIGVTVSPDRQMHSERNDGTNTRNTSNDHTFVSRMNQLCTSRTLPNCMSMSMYTLISHSSFSLNMKHFLLLSLFIHFTFDSIHSCLAWTWRKQNQFICDICDVLADTSMRDSNKNQTKQTKMSKRLAGDIRTFV